MRSTGLAILAAIAIGCTSTPTAPTPAADSAAVLYEQAHKPSPASTTHTITLYLTARGLSPNIRPVGLPVDVWSGSFVRQTLVVNQRGSVTFVLPAADTWFGFAVPDWNGVCAETEIVSLPGGSDPTWNHTHNLRTGCF